MYAYNTTASRLIARQVLRAIDDLWIQLVTLLINVFSFFLFTVLFLYRIHICFCIHQLLYHRLPFPKNSRPALHIIYTAKSDLCDIYKYTCPHSSGGVILYTMPIYTLITLLFHRFLISFLFMLYVLNIRKTNRSEINL